MVKKHFERPDEAGDEFYDFSIKIALKVLRTFEIYVYNFSPS
jgi:hypothetical protein